MSFNHEQDENGDAQAITTYFLDAEQSAFSRRDNLDFAYVKIKDNPTTPLTQWNFLEVDTFSEPQPGDLLSLFSIPKANPSSLQSVITLFLVLGSSTFFTKPILWGDRADRPVLNYELKVIALHHYGKNEEEGGVVINEAWL